MFLFYLPLLIRSKPEIPTNSSFSSFSISSNRRFRPRISLEIWPAMTTLRFAFFAFSRCSSLMCMQTRVLTPLEAYFSKISFEPSVPPVISTQTLPHLLFSEPLTILGGTWIFASFLYSGMSLRISIKSFSLYGFSFSNVFVR